MGDTLALDSDARPAALRLVSDELMNAFRRVVRESSGAGRSAAPKALGTHGACLFRSDPGTQLPRNRPEKHLTGPGEDGESDGGRTTYLRRNRRTRGHEGPTQPPVRPELCRYPGVADSAPSTLRP
ncbi:hypothetical protein GCM10023322_34780 [Rugosimonospora acidiphila]|uniref:Uncharacterized protein n=1 Tax=Rugosimonospora acidiphila TaxID=556531 RepID=A0ABP9RV29_9ACTN